MAKGKAEGLIPLQPRAGFAVGTANPGVLGENDATGAFDGKITNVRVKTTAVPDVTKTTAVPAVTGATK